MKINNNNSQPHLLLQLQNNNHHKNKTNTTHSNYKKHSKNIHHKNNILIKNTNSKQQNCQQTQTITQYLKKSLSINNIKHQNQISLSKSNHKQSIQNNIHQNNINNNHKQSVFIPINNSNEIITFRKKHLNNDQKSIHHPLNTLPKSLQKSFKDICKKLKQEQKQKYQYLKPISNIQTLLSNNYNNNSKDLINNHNHSLINHRPNLDLIKNKKKIKKNFQIKTSVNTTTHLQNNNDQIFQLYNKNSKKKQSDNILDSSTMQSQKLFIPNFKSKSNHHNKAKSYLYSYKHSKRNSSLLPSLKRQLIVKSPVKNYEIQNSNQYQSTLLTSLQNSANNKSLKNKQFVNVNLDIHINNKRTQNISKRNIIKSNQRQYNKSSIQQIIQSKDNINQNQNKNNFKKNKEDQTQHKKNKIQNKQGIIKNQYKRKKKDNISSKLFQLDLGQQPSQYISHNIIKGSKQYKMIQPSNDKKNPVLMKKQAVKARKIASQLQFSSQYKNEQYINKNCRSNQKLKRLNSSKKILINQDSIKCKEGEYKKDSNRRSSPSKIDLIFQ